MGGRLQGYVAWGNFGQDLARFKMAAPCGSRSWQDVNKRSTVASDPSWWLSWRPSQTRGQEISKNTRCWGRLAPSAVIKQTATSKRSADRRRDTMEQTTFCQPLSRPQQDTYKLRKTRKS